MKKIAHLIALLLTISLIGCSTLNKDQPKEYSYLAAVVQKDAVWGHGEWDAFITKLSDRHLSELALDWGMLDDKSEGVNVTWNGKQKLLSIGDPAVAINGKSGRHEIAYKLRRELISAAYTASLLQRTVKWHEIVTWAGKKSGVNKPYAKNSFDAERDLINKIFEKSWDKLDPNQRKSVIENSKLSELSTKDKTAIASGSGAIALATLNTTVALSGFTFYTTMSSVIAATANVLGVTLPFVVYTSMSTTVAALTGPVGWTILAAASTGLAIYALSPDEAKVTRMIISLHLLKARALEESMQ